ncbi:UNVERIFIED_CONTAM: hypothetical protein GTU68_045615 [Idotea baltica]|nr:hypothetical protein [Idotea baltica]
MNLAQANLVGDIGGTNARFALVDDHNNPQQAKTYAAEEYGSLADALRRYFQDVAIEAPSSAAIAVATRVLDDDVEFTNNERWSFSIDALGKDLNIPHLHVINDFTALALSVPHIAQSNLEKVGRGESRINEPLGVVGPGTGFGVSGMIPIDDRGNWRALDSEGGHCSASVLTERELAVFSVFVKRFGHVSFERFLSGPGLVNIVNALRKIDGVPQAEIEPEIVTRDGLNGSDAQCEEALALHIFCALLGSHWLALALTSRFWRSVCWRGIVPPAWVSFSRNSQSRRALKPRGV